MGGFEKFCWIVTILASLAAFAILGTALLGHGLAAPDQAVLAVVGVGIAIVPYVFTRAIQALGRDTQQHAAGKPLPAAAAPAAEPAAEPALRETPAPSRAAPEEPAPWITEPALDLPAPEPVFDLPAPEPALDLPAPEPPITLVAMERLVPPPPPPPRRTALERAFWVLIAILVIIIVVGIILIRNGP